MQRAQVSRGKYSLRRLLPCISRVPPRSAFGEPRTWEWEIGNRHEAAGIPVRRRLLSTIRYTARVRSSGDVLREARHQAGLSQVELARRAGVTQSVVSAYESGARQPSLPMLERLVRATGSELDLLLRQSPSASNGLLAQSLRLHRQRIKLIVASHGLRHVRIFGSVARGEEGPESDIDLLVDVPPGVGLFELGRCQSELESLLGAKVDLIPAADLKAGVTADVLSEAREL